MARSKRTKREERPLRGGARTAQRKLLLEAAGRLLLDHGPEALSLRRIAGEVNASTTMAYTLFGGKGGVVAALRTEGFERLAQTFDRSTRPSGSLHTAPRSGASLIDRVRPARDPLATLKGFGLAYREFALAEPACFSLMAGRALPGVEPASAAEVRTTRAYLLFKEAVQACIRQGQFPRGDPEGITDGLWAVAHGMAGLELAGYFPSQAIAKARFIRALTATARGYAR